MGGTSIYCTNKRQCKVGAQSSGTLGILDRSLVRNRQFSSKLKLEQLSSYKTLTYIIYIYINIYVVYKYIHCIHSFSNLSDDRSNASSKTMPPHSAIQNFLLQMRVSSPVLKVIQQLLTSSSSSSCHFHLTLYLSFDNLFQKAVSA